MSVSADVALRAGRTARKASFDFGQDPHLQNAVRQLSESVSGLDPRDLNTAVARELSDAATSLAFGNKLPEVYTSYPHSYDDDISIAQGLERLKFDVLNGRTPTTQHRRLEEATILQGSPQRALLAAKRIILGRLMNEPMPRRRSRCCSIFRTAIAVGVVIGGVYLFKQYSPVYLWPKLENLCLPCMLTNNRIANWISGMGKYLKLF